MAFAPRQLSQSWCSVLAPAAGGGKPNSTEAWMRRLGWLTAVVAGIATAIAGPAAPAASPGLEGVPRLAGLLRRRPEVQRRHARDGPLRLEALRVHQCRFGAARSRPGQPDRRLRSAGPRPGERRSARLRADRSQPMQ